MRDFATRILRAVQLLARYLSPLTSTAHLLLLTSHLSLLTSYFSLLSSHFSLLTSYFSPLTSLYLLHDFRHPLRLQRGDRG